MRAAFAAWNDRIAPVFDVARQVHLVEARGGRIVSEGREPLPAQWPAQRALHLVELGADTLVCGAISRPMQGLIASFGIRVFPFVAGELHEVIAAWMSGGLKRGGYDMPGCCRRARRGRAMSRVEREEDGMSGEGSPAVPGRGGQGRRQGRMAGGQGNASRGQWRRGGSAAAGPGGACVCSRCGHEARHRPGMPCARMACPQCGAAMTRR